MRSTVAKLNETTGRRFDWTKPNTQKEIVRAIRAGAKLSELHAVIAYCWEEWGADPKMAGKVDHTTPFRAANFNRYLEAAAAGKPCLRLDGKQDDAPSFGLPGERGYGRE